MLRTRHVGRMGPTELFGVGPKRKTVSPFVFRNQKELKKRKRNQKELKKRGKKKKSLGWIFGNTPGHFECSPDQFVKASHFRNYHRKIF